MSGGALEVYHLRLSQSERVVWLLEELGLSYDLHVFERDSQTGLAPPNLKEMTPAGTSPYFRDTTVSPPVELFESGAIVEYILAVHGPRAHGARLSRSPQDRDFATYLNWLHFSNASLQPSVARVMTLLFAGQSDSPTGKRFTEKLFSQVQMLDKHLSANKWLAGAELSAADCMAVFSLTTMRGFCPILDLGPYAHVLRYLRDVADRPAYKEALKNGDSGMRPMIEPKEKGFAQFAGFAQALKAAGAL